MPKLARNYDSVYGDPYYYQSYTKYNYSVYENVRTEKISRYSSLRHENRPKRKVNKKKTFVQVLTAFVFFVVMAMTALPYAFSHVTKAFFEPTPHNAITADMNEISFPTTKYLSNTWAFDNPMFNYSASEKSAMMTPLKENVNITHDSSLNRIVDLNINDTVNDITEDIK